MQDVTHQTFDAGANPYAGGAATTSVQEVYNDLPTLQRSIMQYVSTRNQAGDAGEEGIHVEAVCRSVGGEEREVRQEIANLIEEGHLYETIDESQYVAIRLALSSLLSLARRSGVCVAHTSRANPQHPADSVLKMLMSGGVGSGPLASMFRSTRVTSVHFSLPSSRMRARKTVAAMQDNSR